MAYRESDHTILLRDGSADHKGKGVTKLRSPQRKHGLDKKGRENMQTSLRGMAGRAKGHKKFKFGNLYSLLNDENLKSCFYELKRDAVPGADKIDYYEYLKNLDANISDLVKRLKKRK